MSPNRVTNTRWSSSSDESILIFFMNLRKEGFVPKIGSNIICFMSLMQVNSFFISCLESLKWLRRLQKGSFFVNKASQSEKEITYPRLVDRSDSFPRVNATSSLGNIFVFWEDWKELKYNSLTKYLFHNPLLMSMKKWKSILDTFLLEF